MRRSDLFPSADDCRRWDDRLTVLLADAEHRVARGPVTPSIDLPDFLAALRGFDFERRMPIEDLCAWTIRHMETGVVHMNHPRYLGLFNPSPSFPARCADRIVSAFNPQLATATTSPVAVAIEAHVARMMARRAGLGDEAGGHFTSGGSEANYTALICAMTQSEPGFAERGARAFSGQPVFYTSKESHLAWIKIAHQAGIGRGAVRLVATDGSGRMDPAALSERIAADRAVGCVPVMIVATAGTTNAGMIDPLEACGAIARGLRIWYHIDAAWGGGLIASDTLRGLLAGIGRADSVTIDAHKWFSVTMGCGLFLTRHPPVLSAAFNVSASYMPSHDVAADPYVTTAQWSRRFNGLRLFLSLGAGGWAAHARHVERATELARLLAREAEDLGWRVANDPALAVVCLVPPPGSSAVQEVVRRVLASGGAWVSAAVFEGVHVVRACVTHGETTEADIADVIALLDAARRPNQPSGGDAYRIRPFQTASLNDGD
jgi:glutamate/tyrosine decarboxylase-like PLP-dependent enzyme